MISLSDNVNVIAENSDLYCSRRKRAEQLSCTIT